MVGDILKLARVGVELQRAQSPVSSCNFALLSCLLLAWIAVALMKPRKAVVTGIRCNGCKKEAKGKGAVHGLNVSYLWQADLLFLTDGKVKSINWWSSTEDRELTRHEGLGPARPQSSWSLNSRLLLSAAGTTWLSRVPPSVWGSEHKLIAPVISSG